MVIWENADLNISEQNAKKKRVVGKSKNLDKDIESYLGLVFHKFMENSKSEGQSLEIKVNGNLVTPFNPVHTDFLDKEWIPIVDNFAIDLKISSFIVVVFSLTEIKSVFVFDLYF